MSWFLRHAFLYTFAIYGFMPHYLYLKSLYKKLHKVYLMRGGKYCKVVLNDVAGIEKIVWITIKDLHLLNKDGTRFDNEHQFLDKDGQLTHQVTAQLDYFHYFGTPHNNEVVYFMKEGVVHQPEIFEMVLRGYNIDDSDYEINTEDNLRWLEPQKNN